MTSHLEHRVKAHVFLCFLAAHLTHHLRNTLAELTYTDKTPPNRTDPVAPATTCGPSLTVRILASLMVRVLRKWKRPHRGVGGAVWSAG